MQTVNNSIVTAEQYNKFYAATVNAKHANVKGGKLLPRSASQKGIRPNARHKIERLNKERPLLQSGGMQREIATTQSMYMH